MSARPRYERVLVANRGEIAARVLVASRVLGLSTVAVYSEADAGAPYLALADRAVAIGPSPASESYLNSAVLVETARLTGAQAVHPGYGFLSENSAFAADCERAGLIFVGPTSSVIETMSRKDRARQIAEGAGLSVLPVAEGRDDDELAASVAARIGYPALIKAVAGGGGKAMHLVADEGELVVALAAARREAQAAFGDDNVLVERFVEHGRHVEVQVAADEQGHVLHMFERDCSVQRRHQKVIEEAPAPKLEVSVRERLLSAAVRLAGAVGYLNLGTVEFLVAGDEAFFLEMNTRLQVEHRVTEAVTGLDLVQLQLQIAQGLPIPFSQGEVTCAGHAIEARVYAEDPEAGYLPQAGTPSFVRLAPDALVDGAVSAGRAVTTFYDPMLAKIVVSGPSREVARARLVAALDDSAIFGLRTNIGLCRRLATSDAFAQALIDVNTLDGETVTASPDEALVALAVAADVLAGSGGGTPLGEDDGWRLGSARVPTTLVISTAAGDRSVVVERASSTVHLVDRDVVVVVLEETASRRRCRVGGFEGIFHIARDPDGVTIGYRGATYRFELSRRSGGSRHAPRLEDLIRAPMPGVVLQMEARVGAKVHQGEVLAVLESMKMEFPLRSPRDGVVAEVSAAQGDHVGLDAGLIRLVKAATSEQGDRRPGSKP